MKQRLDQRQVQKLILAPALQQAIKLLPMTNLELIEVIDTELSENPMLEIEEETEEKKTEAETPEPEAGAEPASAEPPDQAPDDPEPPSDSEEREFESYFQEYFDEGFRPQPVERREDGPTLEGTLPGPDTLYDHLDWQANLTFFEPDEKEAAERIIGNINEDGYLVQAPAELAEAAGLPLETVEAVRAKIQMFDPVGVGSLDLRECLLAQMDYLQIKD